MARVIIVTDSTSELFGATSSPNKELQYTQFLNHYQYYNRRSIYFEYQLLFDEICHIHSIQKLVLHAILYTDNNDYVSGQQDTTDHTIQHFYTIYRNSSGNSSDNTYDCILTFFLESISSRLAKSLQLT